jgi:hypothetical protein
MESVGKLLPDCNTVFQHPDYMSHIPEDSTHQTNHVNCYTNWMVPIGSCDYNDDILGFHQEQDRPTLLQADQHRG